MQLMNPQDWNHPVLRGLETSSATQWTEAPQSPTEL